MADHIDPNFARRVAEYQRKAKSGIAFQAEGTLGGKRKKPAGSAWRSNPFSSLFKLITLLVFIKVSVYHLGQTFDLIPEKVVVSKDTSILEKAQILAFYPDDLSVSISWFVTMLQTQVAQELRGLLSLDVAKVVDKEGEQAGDAAAPKGDAAASPEAPKQ